MIKRWLITFGVAWLLGCVVTVLVAWHMALRGAPESSLAIDSDLVWPTQPPTGWPTRPRNVQHCTRRWLGVPGVTHISAVASTSDGGVRMEVTRAGWPLPAAESVHCVTVSEDSDNFETTTLFKTGLVIPVHWAATSRFNAECGPRLPSTPVWLGLVVNSVIASTPFIVLLTTLRLGTQRTLRDPLLRRRCATCRLTLITVVAGLCASIGVAQALWFVWRTSSGTSLTFSATEQYASPESRASFLLALAVDTLDWPDTPPPHWASTPTVFRSGGTTIGVSQCFYSDDRAPIYPGRFPEDVVPRMTATVYQIGWPLACFEGVEFVEYNKTLTATRTLGGSSLSFPLFRAAPGGLVDARLLPKRPIWLGLVANTLLYGYLITLPLLSVRAVRVVGRRRRGACESCGYSRAGLDASTPCPECSAAVQARRTS